MASKDLKLDLKIGTQEAAKNVKAVAAETKKLGTELDDTRSAGKKMADAMDQVTDQMQSEFKGAVRAAEKLGKALGPDLVADINKGGKSVDDVVADLKRAGLTYQDVENDADQLAAAMRRANEVGQSIDTHITKNMKNVAKEADNSRSVFANFTGNAIQELPGVSSAMGPLNMAIGQFTEYATEGNIGLMQFVKFAGPIAGLGLALAAVTHLMQKSGESAKVARERIKGMADALYDNGERSKSAREKLIDYYTGLKKIEVQVDNISEAQARGAKGQEVYTHSGKLLGYSLEVTQRHTEDLTKAMARNNVTVGEWVDLVQASTATQQKWRETALANGMAEKDVNDILAGAIAEHGKYQQATADSTERLAVFGHTADGTVTKVRTLTEALDAQGHAYDVLTGKLSNDDAYQNLQLTLGDLTKELADLAEQEASGAITHEQAMRKSALAVNASKEAVLAYAKEVLKVPPRVATEITTLIDQGKLAEAQAKIDQLARARTALITTVVVGNDVHNSGKKVKTAASGVESSPGGVTLVGENGPELVDLPEGSTVHPNHKTNRMLQQGRGGYVDNRTFHISLPSQTPESLALALDRYARRNGF